MKTHSTDVRRCVLAAIDAGMARTEAVRVFQVSLASIKRWLAQRTMTGSFAPKPRRGKTATITHAQEATLRFQLDHFPDVTLEEHATRWNADHGTTLSAWTLGRAIRRLEWTRKKSP